MAKGVLIVPLVERLKENEQRARQLMPPEVQHHLDPGTILAAHQWYPEDEFFALLKVAGTIMPRQGGRTSYEPRRTMRRS